MKKAFAVSIMMLIASGILAGHPAFAHNFAQNSDADLIAKIQESKAESKLIANNISNSSVAQWHISKSQEYWGSNEMSLLDQKDSSLASQISTDMDDLYSMAGQQNTDPTIANQKADTLNHLLDQAEPEMTSSSSQNNATVQALAMVDVLNEVLKDYGAAIGSSVDLTNMNNMNMSGMSSSGSMQGMSGMSSAPIVNDAAYQSAQALTSTAQTMFSNLQSIAPTSASPYLTKAGPALSDLKQKIDSKSSGNDVMTVV
ncbi:MAG: hypothetical protein KGI25_03115, partial [Thaumarchaeota archaeon]|nr:hypothetical protein [Nitrososphaerota archaeon]